jgi:hypothetical protein
MSCRLIWLISLNWEKSILIFQDNNSFRIYKFLNQVPLFSRDKQGVNIPIILVQIYYCFLPIVIYSKIIDRMESLNLYSYRHLKKDDNFRSQCFIRMLSKWCRSDFYNGMVLYLEQKSYLN